MEEPFRAYIIDWRLPDMNGIEVTRQIRALGDQTPIIMTAYDWNDIEAETKAVGVTADSRSERSCAFQYACFCHDRQRALSAKECCGFRVRPARNHEKALNVMEKHGILNRKGFLAILYGFPCKSDKKHAKSDKKGLTDMEVPAIICKSKRRSGPFGTQCCSS